MSTPAGPAILPAVHKCVRCGASVGIPADFPDLHARVHAHLVAQHSYLGLAAAQLPASAAYVVAFGGTLPPPAAPQNGS